MLDFPNLGYNVNVFIAVKTKKSFLKFLENDCVNSFYQVDTGYDYMIEVVCKDLAEFKQFISSIETEVEEYKLFQIIKTIEKEKFLGGKEK